MALSPRRGKRATGTLLYRGYSATPRPVSRRGGDYGARPIACRLPGTTAPHRRSTVRGSSVVGRQFSLLCRSVRIAVAFVDSVASNDVAVFAPSASVSFYCYYFWSVIILVSVFSVLPSKKFSVPNQVWFLVRLQKFTRIYYNIHKCAFDFFFLLSKIVVIVGTKPNRGDIK